MRRLAILLAMAVLSATLLTACGGKKNDCPEAYAAVLESLYDAEQDKSYAVKDIDGDGMEELLVLDATMAVTVYNTTGMIGSHTFSTESLRLLDTENAAYPGVICFTVGSGLHHYQYLTVREGKMVVEMLWQFNYSGISAFGSNSTREYSEDKQLMEAARLAYEKDFDIPFYTIKP